MALFDPDHVHHDVAHDWFADHREEGWATCASTENGMIRVLSHPSYGGGGKGGVRRPVELIDPLRSFSASGHHVFWNDAISLRNEKLFNLSFVRGHAQIADVFLLGLARKMGGRLATFDRTIPLNAVIGARRQHLVVISDADT